MIGTFGTTTGGGSGRGGAGRDVPRFNIWLCS